MQSHGPKYRHACLLIHAFLLFSTGVCVCVCSERVRRESYISVMLFFLIIFYFLHSHCLSHSLYLCVSASPCSSANGEEVLVEELGFLRISLHVLPFCAPLSDSPSFLTIDYYPLVVINVLRQQMEAVIIGQKDSSFKR